MLLLLATLNYSTKGVGHYLKQRSTAIGKNHLPEYNTWNLTCVCLSLMLPHLRMKT